MKDLKEIILYGIFGVLTTVVNIVTFYVLYDIGHLYLILANVIAWFVSVLFAYITNRKYVFKTKNDDISKEIALFFGARIFSLVVDTVIIYIGIDIMHLDALFIKILSNIVVIVLNYIFSKFIIFKAK